MAGAATGISSGVVGSFAHLDEMMNALVSARSAGLTVQDVFSPVPVEEANAFVRPGRSPVRFVTFAGGLSGLVGGFALALLTSQVWDLIVGGKPVNNFIPFVVVGFELTILIGALATLMALLGFARLPFRGFPGPAYRPQFSADRFGIWLSCGDDRVDEAQELLDRCGAEEVTRLGAGATTADIRSARTGVVS